MIAGIETGGTKVVCAIGESADPASISVTRRIPTTTPAGTLAAINDFLAEAHERSALTGIGVAAFGPLNVDPALPHYGWITGTSKPGWRDVDLIGGVHLSSTIPTVLLSDVSGAALGEQRWGAGRDTRTLAYATFGTGVGVGIVRNGRVLAGNGYPELGHVLVRRHPADRFEGICPFHGDCLEGLASGPAVLARWGADSSNLPGAIADEAHDIIGYYAAQVAAIVSYTTGADRVVLGGGVMRADGVFEAAVRQLEAVTGGSSAGHPIRHDGAGHLAMPELGLLSGVVGALTAAADAVAVAALPAQRREA